MMKAFPSISKLNKQRDKMKEDKFIDKLSLLIAGITLLISFGIFYKNTMEWGGSLAAALMTAGLVWVTYLILRWLIVANRS
jgi:hypothetical protein